MFGIVGFREVIATSNWTMTVKRGNTQNQSEFRCSQVFLGLYPIFLPLTFMKRN